MTHVENDAPDTCLLSDHIARRCQHADPAALYRCSQEPHPGREFYGDGGCAECGYTPAEGPATVTLTDDEDVILADWWVSASGGDHEDPELDLLAAVVEQIIEARVGAPTADLSAADANVAAANRRWCAAERVIANVRALAEGCEHPPRVGGWCPACASFLALLPAAPTAEVTP